MSANIGSGHQRTFSMIELVIIGIMALMLVLMICAAWALHEAPHAATRSNCVM